MKGPKGRGSYCHVYEHTICYICSKAILIFLFCCVAGTEKNTIFCHMTVVIPKGNNEADNQYGPVRGVDRLRNSRLLTSDPGA